MLCPFFQLFFKGAVLLVDVEIIAFKEIIGYVNIGIVVIVDISHSNPQAKPNQASDRCLLLRLHL